MGFHEIAFPKKKGAELNAAKPYVQEVYQNCFPEVKTPKGPGVRSVKVGQIGHISYHSIPSQKGWVSLFVLALIIWKSPLHTPEMRAVSLVGAFLYTLAESAFTQVERGKNYTSLAQFIGNLVYIPVLVKIYPVVLEYFGINNYLCFVLLYPFNIWVLEVLQDLFIIGPIWGHNVAWCYKDYQDELLDGVIRLGHAPAWWVLGAIIALGKRPMEVLVRKATGNEDFALWEWGVM